MKLLSYIPINTLRNYFTSYFVYKNLFIPNAIISTYFGFLAVLLFKLFPINVNLFFTLQMFFLSLIPLLIWIIVSLFLIFVKKDHSIKNKIYYKKKSNKDIFIFLIPLVPIINYLFKNKETLSSIDAIIILLINIVLLLVFIFFIPKFLESYSSTRNLRSLSTAFFFSVFNMASISGYFSWLERGNFIVQLGLFLFSFFIIWLLLGIEKKLEMMFFILAFFCGNSLLLLFPQNNTSIATSLSSDLFEENKLLNLVKGKQIQTTPNIYLLVYDAYVSNETMLYYGIDNSDQEIYLEEQGFVFYPETYSVGPHTLSTMNKVLNVSNDYYGHIRRGVSGDGIVQKILKENSYKVYGVFPYDYMFRVVGPMYDDYFPKKVMAPYKLLFTGIFMGEFRFDIGLNTVTHDEYVKTKHEIFNQQEWYPVFIYSHSNIPGHSQDSGTCLDNETELYNNRLYEANKEMKEDISIIIENDPNAILILAGDHGPYLTKNCFSTNGIYDSSEISRVDIQDRFGTFLAIRWPSDDYRLYDDIVVLQDIFPVIFSFIYQDETLLQSKIDTSLVDVEFISGVSVKNGIIQGGVDDGKPLFVDEFNSDEK